MVTVSVSFNVYVCYLLSLYWSLSWTLCMSDLQEDWLYKLMEYSYLK